MSEIPPPPPPPPPGSTERPGVETNHDLSSRVRGLSCPSCGGALDVDLGLRVLVCPYCRSPLLAVHELGTRRLAVEARVDGERARELAREWLGSGVSKDPRLAKEAPIGEAFLSFLPFYRVEADCLGFALGKERRRRTVGTGKHRRRQTYLVDVERQVKRSLDRTYPAVNVAEWGDRPGQPARRSAGALRLRRPGPAGDGLPTHRLGGGGARCGRRSIP